ncbi:nitric oxide synthase-interacting protein-like [Mercenaria mercenaria]|uniref:nitric oxide synthase-interacting protein-like n=1 Tax=Mercenaria mercenaria TaxID=6596 RepID=UPI001E1D415C|nr:nitric oxide synthase-interacting protein-like [Mercenaria mercenaria]XP_045175173.1 nitric oxide synthase-interacting protein-like [Mercenaria mercenaria]XP_045175174.1 nitric oxide synthase-interacting protein-like [Mercenaria mercenaria]
MTRHSRNCTAGTVYSYHERQKDQSQSGYGSKQLRLGKDSVKEFDCCCLTLQPCRNPVVTKDGYLYDKEAIISYILQKKKEIARKLKEYEKQKQKAKTEAEEIQKLEDEEKVKKFSSRTLEAPSLKDNKPGPSGQASVSNMKDGKKKELPSFWIPSLTPHAGPKTEEKPDEKVRCPMSGKPIKLKDLIDVHFTDIKDRDSKTALINKQARYVCAVTNDVLGNSVPAAVLRTSGCVVTMDCVEKLIKKDMLDPINSKKMTEKDIIQLQRGASGFSGSGLSLEAKKEGAAMQA